MSITIQTANRTTHRIDFKILKYFSSHWVGNTFWRFCII